MSMGRTYKFFGFSMSYTVLNLPLSVLYLQFVLLFPCTFSPIPVLSLYRNSQILFFFTTLLLGCTPMLSNFKCQYFNYYFLYFFFQKYPTYVSVFFVLSHRQTSLVFTFLCFLKVMPQLCSVTKSFYSL